MRTEVVENLGLAPGAIRHESKDFLLYAPCHGLLADMSTDPFSTALYAWFGGTLDLPAGATHFGYVQTGELMLNHVGRPIVIGPGMYFSAVGPVSVAGTGAGIVVSRIGYKGFFQIGGPVEGTGRLKYIDGCTDSLLLAPVKAGDACLNLLHFPDGINQTSHTHSSMRVGIVAAGSGSCLTLQGDYPLIPGGIFVIPMNALHAFRTSGSSMTIIAYHPDSDFGPTDDDHPMINRTMVGGVSANQIIEIRTR